MIEAYFRKAVNNSLFPSDQVGIDFVSKLKIGDDVKLKASRPRNVQFHRKFFALLDYVFDVWEPEDVDVPVYMRIRDMVPEKNKERFRKEMICLAGYGIPVISLNGDARLEAKSMSFASMDEDTFTDLYNKVVDVCIKRVYQLNMTEQELKNTIDGLMEFS